MMLYEEENKGLCGPRRYLHDGPRAVTWSVTCASPSSKRLPKWPPPTNIIYSWQWLYNVSWRLVVSVCWSRWSNNGGVIPFLCETVAKGGSNSPRWPCLLLEKAWIYIIWSTKSTSTHNEIDGFMDTAVQYWKGGTGSTVGIAAGWMMDAVRRRLEYLKRILERILEGFEHNLNVIWRRSATMTSGGEEAFSNGGSMALKHGTCLGQAVISRAASSDAHAPTERRGG